MNHKLVIIDDEFIVIRGITEIISREQLPYDIVGSAHDGYSAIEVIEEKQPDVVITDIRIPGIDGLSVIEETCKSFPAIKFIIISGFSDFVYAKKALDLGVVDYIEKPITIESLKGALSRVEKYFVGNDNPSDLIFNNLIDATINYSLEDIVKIFETLMNVYKKVFIDFKLYKRRLFAALVSVAEIANEKLKSDTMFHIQYASFDKYTDFESLDKYAKNILSCITNAMQGASSGVEMGEIRKVMQFIAENYQNNIGLNEAAEEVKLNPAYLSFLFKKATGSCFNSYLSDYRIKRAKELLHTSMKISEISEKVGYKDYRYFCYIFKKIIGVTPTEYKRTLS